MTKVKEIEENEQSIFSMTGFTLFVTTVIINIFDRGFNLFLKSYSVTYLVI